jgi:hypothetical protein
VRFLTILLFTLSLQVLCCSPYAQVYRSKIIPINYQAQEEEIISVIIEVKRGKRA